MSLLTKKMYDDYRYYASKYAQAEYKILPEFEFLTKSNKVKLYPIILDFNKIITNKYNCIHIYIRCRGTNMPTNSNYINYTCSYCID